jgi:ParB family chromosome partitioning protein
VVGGGRRLVALHALLKEGALPKGHGVPCLVVDSDNAAELSLAENTVRGAMHPADEFEAFAALAKTQPAVDIARALRRHLNGTSCSG